MIYGTRISQQRCRSLPAAGSQSSPQRSVRRIRPPQGRARSGRRAARRRQAGRRQRSGRAANPGVGVSQVPQYQEWRPELDRSVQNAKEAASNTCRSHWETSSPSIIKHYDMQSTVHFCGSDSGRVPGDWVQMTTPGRRHRRGCSRTRTPRQRSRRCGSWQMSSESCCRTGRKQSRPQAATQPSAGAVRRRGHRMRRCGWRCQEPSPLPCALIRGRACVSSSGALTQNVSGALLAADANSACNGLASTCIA